MVEPVSGMVILVISTSSASSNGAAKVDPHTASTAATVAMPVPYHQCRIGFSIRSRQNEARKCRAQNPELQDSDRSTAMRAQDCRSTGPAGPVALQAEFPCQTFLLVMTLRECPADFLRRSSYGQPPLWRGSEFRPGTAPR